MKFSDVLSLALLHLRGDRLRSIITIVIIAFGIMALVGIITAIEAMNQKLMESFSTMGSDGFAISQNERRIRGDRGVQVKNNARNAVRNTSNRAITPAEAEAFASTFDYPATVSLAAFAGSNHRVSTGQRRTNPGVLLVGSDENYIILNGLTVAYGRNMSAAEVNKGGAVCLLGAGVAEKLFPNNPAAALQQTVRLDHVDYRVAGVLASRGSTFGFSRDNLVVTTYKHVYRYFDRASFRIGVKTDGLNKAEAAMGEAEGLFRRLRKLPATVASDFSVDRSDSLVSKAMNSMRFITIAVVVIGVITLAGAAIGLMNILLVAVAERTREIGMVRAIGSSARAVRQQFLAEAVLISVAGAGAGAVAGLAVGNVFASFLQTEFIIPWNWLFYGIIMSVGVGLLAGVYPAWKAGRLNPMEALRYE